VRFASLESVRQGAAAALRRFPVTLACAWVTCAFCDFIVVANGYHPRALAAATLLTLGIPLTFAVTLRAERSASRSPAARWLPPLVILAILAILVCVWPGWTSAIQLRRYLQLSLFAHAVVAFLPYLGLREPNGFWQYNRTLLERFVLASIFSAVLLGGLTGALASLHPLFGIEVSPKVFSLVATWVLLVFHPWFFLAGIPGDLGALEERHDYPGTVRIFAQFILVPLVAIYQALLTAYLVKVVLTGKWPSGIIGWLVSVEAVAGILAILLVHPVRERAENLWVRTFARGFYVALLPSIVMMALAIAKRVGQYGLTEDRYFVIALTAWLAAIALFFIARRDGDIRWIPISLALLAVITFGGPWGAYEVSRASQHARLVRLLEANGMWKDGHVVRPAGEPPFQARRDLSSLLEYLLDRHGGAGVRPELAVPLAAADSGFANPERDSGASRAQRLATRMGFVFLYSWDRNGTAQNELSWSQPWTEGQIASRVDDYEYHARIEGTDTPFRAGSRWLRLWLDSKKRRLVLTDEHGRLGDPHKEPVDTLATASVDTLLAATRVGRIDGAPLPHVDLVGPGARGVLRVTRVMGMATEFNIYSLSGDLYFSLTPASSQR